MTHNPRNARLRLAATLVALALLHGLSGAARAVSPQDPPGGGGPGPNAAPVDYTRPFKLNEGTKRGLITYKPEPGFTEEARKNGAEGIVRLHAILSASGEVTDISVVKGLPDGLTEKAIDAARQVRFKPADKDGRVVSQYIDFEYYFTIHLEKDKVDKRAVIIEQPPAEYTDEARCNNVRGDR